MAAGAEIRYGGKVQWLDVDTRQPCPRKAPQVIAVLRPNTGTEARVPPSPPVTVGRPNQTTKGE